MPYQQVDPRNFDWGGQFQAGVDNAQDTQRRNALLDLEQKQYGLQERGAALREQAYGDEAKQRQKQMDAQLQQESVQHKAMAALYGDERAGLELLTSQGFDPAHAQELVKSPDVKELYQHFAGIQQQDVGPLEQYVGPDGNPVFGTREQAVGQTPYRVPQGPTGGDRQAFAQWYLAQPPDVQAKVNEMNRGYSGAGDLRDQSFARQTGKGESERYAEYIDNGLKAADSIAIVRRGLSLLGEVKTGGIDAVKLKATNLFGITGADEAELSSNLGKAVLSQLRATFGAQFTEKEGARLSEIEAGFGKSTEGNKRLLEQAGKILDRVARRGLDAANKSGDTFSANEIRNSMKTDFGKPGNEPSPQPQGGWSIEPAP